LSTPPPALPVRQEPDDHTEIVNQARLTALGTMVAGIAHELNTPLGAIHSNHDVIERALLKLQDILEDEVVTPDELEQVRRIVKAMDGVLHTNAIAVERMVKLVEGLRTFGRPDRADIDQVDLHEGIESTLMILAHELREVEVVRNFGTLPAVECYPNRINQVFMNLIHNAIQAMDGQGVLTIETSVTDDGRFADVEVTDTGRGIPKENLAKIFQPGFTTKAGRVGMGIGLAICRQIVDQHGGRLTATSEPGEGAVFRMRLPTRLGGQPEEGENVDALA
jgi:signal transduction histidine kinase